MLQALPERKRGQHTQALNTLKSIIAAEAIELHIKRWAVQMLLAVGSHVARANLSQYLNTISVQELATTIASVLPACCLREGAIARALETYQQNIARYPNTPLERLALYAKFLHF